MGINMPQAPVSPLDKIATALSIANSVYGIKHASAQTDALEQALVKAKADTAAQTMKMDPTSAESQLKQQATVSTLGSLLKSKEISPQDYSTLKEKILGSAAVPGTSQPIEDPETRAATGLSEFSTEGKPAVPGATASALDSMKETNPLFALATKDKTLAAAVARMGFGFGEREKIQQNGIDNRIHQQTLAAIRKDPNEAKRLGQYQNLDNATTTLFSNQITPQSIHEFQQAVRSNLGIGGGGVGERAQTYMDSIGLHGAAWAQMLTGDPANIASDNKIVQHFKDLASTEQANIRQNMNDRLNFLTSGNEDMYERRDDLRRGLMNAISSAKKQYKGDPLAISPEGAPSGGGLIPSANASTGGGAAKLPFSVDAIDTVLKKRGHL